MKLDLWIVIAASCLLPSAHFFPSPARCIPTQTPGGSAAQQAKKTPAPLDINRATAEEFTTLPGIGPELARRIVAHREKHGPFRRVEDLLAIKGMGRKKWRAIRSYLVVGNPRETP